MKKIVIAALVAVTILAGCAKNSATTTCSYDPCGIKAPATEITQLESYLSGAGITTATKYCSGLYYEVLAPGTDKVPTVCSYVTVNYSGKLTSGKVFDATAGTPASFTLVSLIEGWKQGLPLIKKSGRIRLYIPPSLGYGANDQKDAAGNVIIPGNSILIFDIELVDSQ